MTNPTPKEIIELLREVDANEHSKYNGQGLPQITTDTQKAVRAAIDYIKATMWVPINSLYVVKGCTPDPVIVTFDNGYTVSFIKRGEYVPDYITHFIPLYALGEPE